MKEDKISIVEWIFIVVLISMGVWFIVEVYEAIDKGLFG